MLARLFLHQLSGHDHGLLVRQRDILAGSDGREGRHQAGPADDGRHDQIRLGQSRHACDAVHTGQDLHGGIPAPVPEPGGGGFVGQRHRSGLEDAKLLLELFIVGARGETNDPELLGELGHDIQRVGSNRSGRSQNHDLLHSNNPLKGKGLEAMGYRQWQISHELSPIPQLVSPIA